MTGTFISGTFYARVVACGTPGTHSWKGCKSCVMAKCPGKFFKFQDSRLNYFFTVFHYCFQVILVLLFYNLIFGRLNGVFREILTDFSGKNIIRFPFNKKSSFVICKHLFKFIYCRNERRTYPASITVAPKNAL